MLPHPTPSMESPFFMQASMETRRSHHPVTNKRSSESSINQIQYRAMCEKSIM